MTWDALEQATGAAQQSDRSVLAGRAGTHHHFPVGLASRRVPSWNGFRFSWRFSRQTGVRRAVGHRHLSGAAQGYGGPDPAGWLVIDSSRAEGGGCVEYGHIIREVAKGERVTAGQRIARINPNSQTNGGVAPHLHLSVMPREYDPGAKSTLCRGWATRYRPNPCRCGPLFRRSRPEPTEARRTAHGWRSPRRACASAWSAGGPACPAAAGQRSHSSWGCRAVLAPVVPRRPLPW